LHHVGEGCFTIETRNAGKYLDRNNLSITVYVFL